MTTDAPLSDDIMVARHPHVVGAEVSDEAVVFSLASGIFFQLNQTGARIWTLLETPRTLDDLCTRLEGEFARGATDISGDLREFILAMRERELLEFHA